MSSVDGPNGRAAKDRVDPFAVPARPDTGVLADLGWGQIRRGVSPLLRHRPRGRCPCLQSVRAVLMVRLDLRICRQSAQMLKASPESPRMFESDFVDFFSRTHPAVVPILFVPAALYLTWYSAVRAGVGVFTTLLLV